MDTDLVVDRLLQLCKQKAITGIQFGAALGLKKSPLTDWKNKKSKPTLDQIFSICEKFAISSDYILFGKVANDHLQQDEQELLSTYKQLDSRGRHKLHTVIYEELDRMQAQASEPPPRRIPFAASGEADITPERDAFIQEKLQQFERQARELKNRR